MDIETLLFSGHPNMSSYVGGLSDELDLKSALDDCPGLNRLKWEVQESIMQNITFDHNGSWAKSLNKKITESPDAFTALSTLRSVWETGLQATRASYGYTAENDIVAILGQQEHESNIPLIRIFSQRYKNALSESMHDNPEGVSLGVHDMEWQERYGFLLRFTYLKDYVTDVRPDRWLLMW